MLYCLEVIKLNIRLPESEAFSFVFTLLLGSFVLYTGILHKQRDAVKSTLLHLLLTGGFI